MDDNQDAKSINTISYPDEDSLDEDEEVNFGIAGVNLQNR
jgi:hypothetical protein